MKKIAKITLEIEVAENWKDIVADREHTEHTSREDQLTDGVACALARKRLAEEAGALSIAKLGTVTVKTFRIDYEGKEKKR